MNIYEFKLGTGRFYFVKAETKGQAQATARTDLGTDMVDRIGEPNQVQPNEIGKYFGVPSTSSSSTTAAGSKQTA